MRIALRSSATNVAVIRTLPRGEVERLLHELAKINTICTARGPHL
jgi:hypothetical protein